MKVLLFLIASSVVSGFQSKPLTHNDTEIDFNKYKQREVPALDTLLFGIDLGDKLETTCVRHPTVEWEVETGASIFSTPVIADLYGNGQKQVISATFSHYVEVVDADSGHDAPGWPYAHADLISHASPLVHDLDSDGTNEIVVAATTGHLVFFSVDGSVLPHRTLKFPPLPVRRSWFVNLEKDDLMYDDAVRRIAADRARKHSKRMVLVPPPTVPGTAAGTGGATGGAGAPTADTANATRPAGPRPHRGGDGHLRAQFESVRAASLPPTTRGSPGGKSGASTKNDALRLRREVAAGAADPSKYRLAKTAKGGAGGAGAGGGGGAALPPGVNLGLLSEHVKEAPDVAARRALERGLGHAIGAGDDKVLTKDEAADLVRGTFDPERIKELQRRIAERRAAASDATLADVAGDVVVRPPLAAVEGGVQVGTLAKGNLGVNANGAVGGATGGGGGGGVNVGSVVGGIGGVQVPDAPTGDDGASGATASTRRRVLAFVDDPVHQQEQERQRQRRRRQTQQRRRRVLSLDEQAEEAGARDDDAYGYGYGDDGGAYGDGGYDSGADWDDSAEDDALYVAQLEELERRDRMSEARGEAGPSGRLSKEARVSFDLVFGREGATGGRLGFERRGGMVEPEDDSESPLYVANWARRRLEFVHNESHVFVDAHLLATPTLVDINQDGVLDVVAAVSYYYDHDHSSAPADIDIDNYVAGGIVVMSLDTPTPRVLWSTQLDLTTNKATWRAYIYTGPTVVDLDGDGSLEVIVGTGLGWVYVFNASGALRKGFPVELASIHGGVAVWDCNGDGVLDILAADMHGNVVAISGADGSELWDEVVVGGVAAPLSIGDVDGDGKMDVVVATIAGKIYALRVQDGTLLPWFPVSTRGPIYSTPLLISLRDAPAEAMLPARNPYTMSQMWQRIVQLTRDVVTQPVPHHIVVPAHDGRLHVIDGKQRCHDAIDIGEHAYGMVLAGDLRGKGKVDLLIPSMSGNIHLLSTNVTAHPLKTKHADTSIVGVSTASEGVYGVYILTGNSGRRLSMQGSIRLFLRIVDNRARPVGHSRRYVVRVSLGAGLGKVLSSRIVHHPGTYAEVIMTPLQRLHTSLVVTVIDDHGRSTSDSIVIDWHTDTHRRFVKFVLVIPFVIACVMLMLVPRDSISGASLRTTITTDEDSVAALVHALMLEMQAAGIQQQGESDDDSGSGSSSDDAANAPAK